MSKDHKVKDQKVDKKVKAASQAKASDATNPKVTSPEDQDLAKAVAVSVDSAVSNKTTNNQATNNQAAEKASKSSAPTSNSSSNSKASATAHDKSTNSEPAQADFTLSSEPVSPSDSASDKKAKAKGNNTEASAKNQANANPKAKASSKEKAKPQRLDKLLSERSPFSRSQIRSLCKQGMVTVDGVPVRDPAAKLDPRTVIYVDEDAFLAIPNNTVLVLNKPKNYVCANHDDTHKTVFSLLPDEYRDGKFHTVGRLDVDTTGLLLITNDGQFSHRMTSPRKDVAKTYRATLANAAQPHYKGAFMNGILLEGEDKPCLPAHYEEVKMPFTVRIKITEGRYHQVKRMFAALGNKVERLHREAIGHLKLSDIHLPEGEFRVYTVQQIENLIYGSQKVPNYRRSQSRQADLFLVPWGKQARLDLPDVAYTDVASEGLTTKKRKEKEPESDGEAPAGDQLETNQANADGTSALNCNETADQTSNQTADQTADQTKTESANGADDYTDEYSESDEYDEYDDDYYRDSYEDFDENAEYNEYGNLVEAGDSDADRNESSQNGESDDSDKPAIPQMFGMSFEDLLAEVAPEKKEKPELDWDKIPTVDELRVNLDLYQLTHELAKEFSRDLSIDLTQDLSKEDFADIVKAMAERYLAKTSEKQEWVREQLRLVEEYYADEPEVKTITTESGMVIQVRSVTDEKEKVVTEKRRLKRTKFTKVVEKAAAVAAAMIRNPDRPRDVAKIAFYPKKRNRPGSIRRLVRREQARRQHKQRFLNELMTSTLIYVKTIRAHWEFTDVIAKEQYELNQELEYLAYVKRHRARQQKKRAFLAEQRAYMRALQRLRKKCAKQGLPVPEWLPGHEPEEVKKAMAAEAREKARAERLARKAEAEAKRLAEEQAQQQAEQQAQQAELQAQQQTEQSQLQAEQTDSSLTDAVKAHNKPTKAKPTKAKVTEKASANTATQALAALRQQFLGKAAEAQAAKTTADQQTAPDEQTSSTEKATADSETAHAELVAEEAAEQAATATSETTTAVDAETGAQVGTEEVTAAEPAVSSSETATESETASITESATATAADAEELVVGEQDAVSVSDEHAQLVKLIQDQADAEDALLSAQQAQLERALRHPDKPLTKAQLRQLKARQAYLAERKAHSALVKEQKFQYAEELRRRKLEKKLARLPPKSKRPKYVRQLTEAMEQRAVWLGGQAQVHKQGTMIRGRAEAAIHHATRAAKRRPMVEPESYVTKEELKYVPVIKPSDIQKAKEARAEQRKRAEQQRIRARKRNYERAVAYLQKQKAKLRQEQERQAQAKQAKAQAQTNGQAPAKAQAKQQGQAKAPAKAISNTPAKTATKAKAPAKAKTKAQAKAPAKTVAKAKAPSQAKAQTKSAAKAQAKTKTKSKA